VTGRDVFVGLLLVNLIHLGISTRSNSQDTNQDSCAVNSWLLIFLEMGTLALLLSSNVVRSINSLSIAAEAVLALIFIAIAIVFAAASGPHRWALKLNEIDYCSAQNNPHAALVYLAADFLGAGSAILERHTRPKHFHPRAMPDPYPQPLPGSDQFLHSRSHQEHADSERHPARGGLGLFAARGH